MTTFFASNINPLGVGGALQTTSQSFVQGNTAFASTTSAKRNVGGLTFTGAIGGGLPIEAAQQNMEMFTPTTFNPLASSNATFDTLNNQFLEEVGGIKNADDVANVDIFQLSQLNRQMSAQSSFYNALQGIFGAAFNGLQVAQAEIEIARNLRQQNIILSQKLAKLERDYQYLQEHCEEAAGTDFLEQALESSINIGTSVKVSFSILYTVYQYFFGYPAGGVFNEFLVDLIRDTLEENGIFVNERPSKETIETGLTPEDQAIVDSFLNEDS